MNLARDLKVSNQKFKEPYLLVKDVFHGRELNLSILRVLHNLGIMPRVDHHCDDPLSVLQPRASQDEVLIVQVD